MGPRARRSKRLLRTAEPGAGYPSRPPGASQSARRPTQRGARRRMVWDAVARPIAAQSPPAQSPPTQSPPAIDREFLFELGGPLLGGAEPLRAQEELHELLVTHLPRRTGHFNQLFDKGGKLVARDVVMRPAE